LFAITGELSLSGSVLKIGGLKEKLLAARQEEISRFIIPAGNRADWDALPTCIKSDCTAVFVSNFAETLKALDL
jgi:ATP-dependent Lon protease